jgi:hypothetical protein
MQLTVDRDSSLLLKAPLMVQSYVLEGFVQSKLSMEWMLKGFKIRILNKHNAEVLI